MKTELVKSGRKTKGFVWHDGNGWSYAFGSPGQLGGYIAFNGNKQPLTKEQAIQRINEA